MKRLGMLVGLGAMLATQAGVSALIPEQVKIDTGLVAGTTTTNPNVRVFKGVPFAAPPLGENRWKPPQPAAKWDSVFKADAFGPSCTAGAGGGRGRGAAPGRGGAPAAPGAPGAAPAAPQAPLPAAPPRQPPASEDCLTVNVWTSANGAADRRPVMVWIYGGGFTGGSGGMQWYDGEDLAAKGPVIVTFNYRLGALGFFAHPELAKESGRNASGNYGMMDAIGALQWVKRNISAFGGDPNNVTIFGESAGAIMIGALVGSPQAKGLFHRAVAQSGAWMGLQMGRMTPGAQTLGAGAKAMEAAGIKTIAELRAKPLAELPALGGGGLTIDGYIIPEDLSLTFANGRQNDVDVLAGSNKDENTFFGGGGRGRGGAGAAGAAPAPGAAVEAYIARAKTQYGELADTYLKLYPASADADVAAAGAQAQNDEINWNMRQFAAAQSKKGRKGYAYFFTRVPLRNGQPQPNGSSHTAEISYVFNHPYSNGTLEWNDVDRKLADTMSSYWVNFATKGDPNGSGLPAWPAYKDISSGQVMVLGDTVQVESAAPAPKLSFFNEVYAKLMKQLAQDNPTGQAQQKPIWIGQDAAIEEALRTLEIERTDKTIVGVLAPRHAFFKPGGLIAGAAIKKIRPGKYDGFFESYKSEIASYKLDRLLELNMVPTTVERRYENEPASAMLWISNTRMLSEVLKGGPRDPNVLRWNQNLHRAQVFDNLSGNLDPNQGNWLFDAAWNFYKIDCSRCFTGTTKMPHDVKKTIKRIDRPFFERLKALDRDTARREIGDLLTENGALPSLFSRRDSIVKAFEELAKQNGDAAVFEAWHAQ